jgi:hypothetical protein
VGRDELELSVWPTVYCDSHFEVPMKKTTLLYVTLAVLFVGALFYQFILHPNPYTGDSPAEDAGFIEQSP